MRFCKSFFIFFLIVTTSLTAQKKDITLQEIWSGAFRTASLDRLHSLNNGQQYSVLNRNRQAMTVDMYDYATAQKVKTLVSSANIDGVDQIRSYSFNADESKLLIASELESIYRRSTLGVYYVVDLQDNSVTKVADTKIQEPTFSPDGSKVAYGYNNNLYVKDLTTNQTRQITTDGKKNHIINGITDWVYEEEFAFVRAFDWNADGDKLAFIRFDETEVPEFSMDVYGSHLYQTQEVFKYPKAGEKNAEVSLHIYDLQNSTTTQIDLSDYQSYYIPRLQWTKEASVLCVQTMNRKQNELDIIFVNAEEMSSKRILKETDVAY